MKRLNIKNITVEEMKYHLDFVWRGRKVYEGNPLKLLGDQTFGNKAFIEIGMTTLSLTYKRGPKVITFKCRLDGEKDLHTISGMDAYICLQRTKDCKIKSFQDDNLVKTRMGFDPENEVFKVSAKPILGYNPKYEGKRIKAYSYDINSSYSNAMLKPMPDTNAEYDINRRVRAGEVGFIQNDEKGIIPVFEGKHAEFIFPLVESPFKRFIERWYTVKKTTKDPIEKQKAKDMLNFPIGYSQKHNPFIRAMILYWANKEIEDRLDDNSIYWNTDSIVSAVPRPDINIGTEIGQFKLEDKGIEFAFVGFNYQWDFEAPGYRGVPKKWFPEGWDILKDKPPKQGNIYQFNWNDGKLKEI